MTAPRRDLRLMQQQAGEVDGRLAAPRRTARSADQLVPQFLDFCKQLRRRFPTGKLYLVSDNYGPHGKAEVRDWCAANDIELIYTPTNASWLNWIECEFTAVRYFTLDGSDYPSHAAQEAAITGYLRWRNRHSHPKRHFAINSKIRRPDYLPNVA
ncbi:transposase [Amycolatopsis carbonis]|uniref:Transposase n=1 Tax=Amycolatopsis carbonis TaxID=715471 RepID=A0A9Y2MQC4_9PSEU|nr:transposase [Amycolatopsis sp. 2-15]WIX77080.1 transposase [Amycolatopsis sp. 2-15]